MSYEYRPFIGLCWKLAKIYDQYLNEAAKQYELTRNEKDVLLFLHNNTAMNTASEIVKYRSISKSLVAKSVASLTKKEYLIQQTDLEDSRFTHLVVTAAAKDALAELKEAQTRFFHVVETSVPMGKKEELIKMISQINQNLDQYM